MAQITTEQALQIPQQLKRQGSQQESYAEPQKSDASKNKILKDDPVSIFRHAPYHVQKKVNVSGYKNELGQDASYVKETLRNKLAEYKLNPQTKLEVKKDTFGQIEIKGSLRPIDHERLTTDLNNNKHFKDSFDRLSQQEPTLNYVDNVVKISNAYGVSNNLFNSLISDQNEHNKLNDIAHRYDALKHSKAEELTEFQAESDAIGAIQSYQFVLNS